MSVKRFRPRRGKASTLATKNPILLSGELIVEVPEGGVGTGKIRMKMGDGSTPYNDLPYAVDSSASDPSDQVVTFEASTTTENSTLLDEIVSGKTLAKLLGSIKKLISNHDSTIADLNTKYTSFESAKSKIISSNLGGALGMTSSTTIADVATKIATVINIGAWNGEIKTSGGTIDVPAGLHSGTGKVYGPTLASLVGSSANLNNAAFLLNGLTALGANGTKYTGTMVNRGLVAGPCGAINSNYTQVPVYEGSNLQAHANTGDGVTRVCVGVPDGFWPNPHSAYVGVPISAFGNATTGHVLSGATFTSSAGLGATGTMTNWSGTPQHIDAVRIANGRFEVAVAPGFHQYYWAGNSYEYMTFDQVTSALGLVAGHLVEGTTIGNISGSIPNRTSNTGSNLLSWTGDGNHTPTSDVNRWIGVSGNQLRIALPYGYYAPWSQVVIPHIVKGDLNWGEGNTTYTVPAGYYTGGTLDSRGSYNWGYNEGHYEDFKGAVTFCRNCATELGWGAHSSIQKVYTVPVGQQTTLFNFSVSMAACVSSVIYDANTAFPNQFQRHNGYYATDNVICYNNGFKQNNRGIISYVAVHNGTSSKLCFVVTANAPGVVVSQVKYRATGQSSIWYAYSFIILFY